MATATPLSLLRLPPLSPPPRPHHSILTLKLPNLALQSNNLRWKFTTLPQKCRPERTPIRAATGEIAPSQVPLEKAQEIVPAASDDGIVSTIISALLFIAFVALCVLTIGVFVVHMLNLCILFFFFDFNFANGLYLIAQLRYR